ncbi:glycosyltransferase [Plantactinospora sp. KBS50]|uniref:glycosyltransferase n=1 Tax=Plantactinospora sp. KBS50 TaxID=2024580 RepID=UPI000BAAED48|nr:glycosyltransferase [Plantactinospora sp. KBS50]ASW54492.1 hypothetical protein CIK06_10300 [Plantactinospora sp. KBS50]
MRASDGDRSPSTPLGILLIDHPVQYFAPGLRLLARQPGLRTRTYYGRVSLDGAYDPGFGRRVRWSTDLYSGYDWWTPRGGRWRSWLGTLRGLRRDRPDVLLSFGWTSRVCRAAFLYALVTRTPILFFSDANIRDPRPLGWRGRLRRRLLRVAFRQAAGALAVGPANHAFYLAHGVPPERLYPGVDSADVDLFFAAADRRRRTPGHRRADGPFVIGYVGKFIAVKAVHDLIEAVARLGPGIAWELWLVGDGPLRAELTALVARLGLTGRVRMFGFRNTDEVPDLVAQLDVLVLPSHVEPRGLVAVEALAAGVPPVVSSVTGVWGPGDTVEHEVSGLVYPVGDVEALVGSLRRLIEDPGLRQRFVAAGRNRAAVQGPQAFAATVAAALRTVAARRAGRPAGSGTPAPIGAGVERR